MHATEIQLEARKLIEARGEGALPHAHACANDCENGGDADGARNWRRIASVIALLRGPGVS